jgi:hypothetical protein
MLRKADMPPIPTTRAKSGLARGAPNNPLRFIALGKEEVESSILPCGGINSSELLTVFFLKSLRSAPNGQKIFSRLPKLPL